MTLLNPSNLRSGHGKSFRQLQRRELDCSVLARRGPRSHGDGYRLRILRIHVLQPVEDRKRDHRNAVVRATLLWNEEKGMTTPSRIRCAIYTRKSSEEGLEQSFNSLDAQRETCEAYIVSQRHEGWELIPTKYDDGGFSGGTMERPALKHLLADIAVRRVDNVVVYKVDRLTRSLADFAKIVEQFENKASALFLSPSSSTPLLRWDDCH